MKHFSTAWKGSTKPRKQRKYRAGLPLHLQKKNFSVHLAKPLRQKYKTRNITLRLGDTVKVMRGRFRKTEGKVERIDRKHEKVYIAGAEILRKDGTKVMVPIHPSTLLIMDLILADKKRMKTLEVKP
jgi:large subunit ribosomal protein L24